MHKPGRWRVALEQLLQATTQILSTPDLDQAAAQLTLDNLRALYQWAGVMQNHELAQLNHAVLQLATALNTE